MTKYEREISVTLPTTEDGFLQRQCPFCDKRFAVESTDYSEGGHLNIRCPYCEMIEETDQFHTEAQAAYAQAVAKNELLGVAEDRVNQMLSDAFGKLRSSKHVKVRKRGRGPDFGSEKIPPAIVDMDAEEVRCSDCGARYQVLIDQQDEAVCPLCRD